MTTVAWDGTILCADTLGLYGGIPHIAHKLWRLHGDRICGGAGTMSTILEMKVWLMEGAQIDKFPSSQRSEDWSPILVISKGLVELYEKTPWPIIRHETQIAIGSGKEAALAAMACGKTAKEAVKIASLFDINTGQDVDEMIL